MNTKKNTVIKTKQPNQVPFKSELIGKETSWKLIFTAGNKKTYNEFVRDCDNPILLHEVLLLKKNEPHFPGFKKIRRIAFYASTAALVTSLFKGKEFAKSISCSVYRFHLPKKQFTNEL